MSCVITSARDELHNSITYTSEIIHADPDCACEGHGLGLLLTEGGENCTLKQCFPAVAARLSMAGSPDCEPAAVCRRYSSSAYRAAVSAYQTSGNNKQRHAVLAEWQRWEGATMPCSNTRTDYKHLHTILPSCGGRTHAAAVR